MNFKTLVLIGSMSWFVAPCVAIMPGDNQSDIIELRARALDNDRIKTHQEKISYSLELNKKVRFAATCTGYAAALAAFLVWYNDFSFVTGNDLRAMRKCMHTVRAMRNSAAFEGDEEVQKYFAMNELKQQSGNGWGSWLGSMAAQFIFSSFVSYLSQKFISPLFHDQSIAWFLAEKTVIADLEKQLLAMKEDIRKLKNGTVEISKSNCDNYVQSLFEVHNTLADQLEMVIGYMRYKVSIFPAGNAALGSNTSGSSLISHISSVADVLNTKYVTYREHARNDDRILIISEMFDALDSLLSRVQSAVKGFRVVEKKIEQAD